MDSTNHQTWVVICTVEAASITRGRDGKSPKIFPPTFLMLEKTGCFNPSTHRRTLVKQIVWESGWNWLGSGSQGKQTKYSGASADFFWGKKQFSYHLSNENNKKNTTSDIVFHEILVGSGSGILDPDTVDGRIPANQLRLVVYPMIFKVLYIPGGAGFIPSTVVMAYERIPNKTGNILYHPLYTTNQLTQKTSLSHLSTLKLLRFSKIIDPSGWMSFSGWEVRIHPGFFGGPGFAYISTPTNRGIPGAPAGPRPSGGVIPWELLPSSDHDWHLHRCNPLKWQILSTRTAIARTIILCFHHHVLDDWPLSQSQINHDANLRPEGKNCSRWQSEWPLGLPSLGHVTEREAQWSRPSANEPSGTSTLFKSENPLKS